MRNMDSTNGQHRNEALQFAILKQPGAGNSRRDGRPQNSQPAPGRTPSAPTPRFLSKVLAQMETNLSNPHFTIEGLSKKMGLSYSSLYRKLGRHTGKCATRLLRDMRLQRACELLRQGTLNVSEVAYETGFASPDYFSRIFSREMGVPPSKYKEASQDRPERRKTAIGCTEFFPG